MLSGQNHPLQKEKAKYRNCRVHSLLDG